MSTYLASDDFLGSNWFTNFMAKLDPTNSKAIGGQIVKGVLSGAGTLVGIPPMVTYGGLTGIGAANKAIKSVSAKQAATPQNVISPEVYSQQPQPQQQSFTQTLQSNPLPLIITAGVGVLILSTMLLLKK